MENTNQVGAGVAVDAAVVPAETGAAGTGDQLTHRRDERGMVSAEWAVGIIAAIAIAGVLAAVVTSGGVQDALLDWVLELISWFADERPGR